MRAIADWLSQLEYTNWVIYLHDDPLAIEQGEEFSTTMRMKSTRGSSNSPYTI